MPVQHAARAMAQHDRERELEPAAAAPEADHSADLLALLSGAGNAAVSRALLARQPAQGDAGGTQTAAEHPELRPGAHDENFGYRGQGYRGVDSQHNRVSEPEAGGDVELLQLKLNWHLSAAHKIGLIVDGAFGPKTAQAVIWFKRAHELRPRTAVVDQATWDALEQEPTTTQPRHPGGPAPDYDQMLSDGLLDITLGIGFDESGLTRAEHHEMRRGLADVRHYEEDQTRAAQMRAAAGRPPPEGAGDWFVKENAAQSHGSPVNAVVRLIGPSPDGASGGEDRAQGAARGMDESDVFAYGGHARYGTGPDFDRNWTLTVHWDLVPESERRGRSGDQQFAVEEEYLHAFHLYDGRRAIEHFDRMRGLGAVDFQGNSGGNLGINPAPVTHAGTLGNHLIGLATEGQPQRLLDAPQEHHYRLWLFNGCVTREYMHAVRHSGNPELGRDQLDVVTNIVPPYVITLAEGVLAFFDGVIAQEGGRALADRMEAAHPESDDRYGTDF